jgi:hypothetical protein
MLPRRFDIGRKEAAEHDYSSPSCKSGQGLDLQSDGNYQFTDARDGYPPSGVPNAPRDHQHQVRTPSSPMGRSGE